MAWNRARLPVVALETAGNISRIEPSRVKPIFECRGRATMAEGSAAPNSSEGWDFVITRTLVGLKSVSWIDADADRQDVRGIRWRLEIIGGNQLVVGVERRRMTVRALFPCEQYAAAFSGNTESVGIRRRAERVKIKCQSIELSIAVTGLRNGRALEVRGAVSIGGEHILSKRTVAHQIADAPMPDQPSVIKKSPIAHAYQIGNLRRQQHAGIRSRCHSGWNRFTGGN